MIKTPQETFSEFYASYSNNIESKETGEFGLGDSLYRLVDGKLQNPNGNPAVRILDHKGNNKYCAFISDNKFEKEVWYSPTGEKVEEVLYGEDGGLSKLDGPSIIRYNKDGSIKEEEYWVANKRQIIASSLGLSHVVKTLFYLDGNETEILTQVLKEDNSLIKEESRVDGKLHSVGGSPSSKFYDKNNKITSHFHNNGVIFRTIKDLPTTKTEVWVNGAGSFHREDGPAYTFYDKETKTTIEEYYLDGENIEKEDFLKMDKEEMMQGKIKKPALKEQPLSTLKESAVKDNNSFKVENKYLNNKLYKRIVSYKDRVATWDAGNLLHSFDDEPAIKYNSGKKEWYYKGKLHRVNGPAIVYASGLEWYYLDGNVMSKEDFKSKKDQFFTTNEFVEEEIKTPQVDPLPSLKAKLVKTSIDNSWEIYDKDSGNLVYRISNSDLVVLKFIDRDKFCEKEFGRSLMKAFKDGYTKKEDFITKYIPTINKFQDVQEKEEAEKTKEIFNGMQELINQFFSPVEDMMKDYSVETSGVVKNHMINNRVVKREIFLDLEHTQLKSVLYLDENGLEHSPMEGFPSFIEKLNNKTCNRYRNHGKPVTDGLSYTEEITTGINKGETIVVINKGGNISERHFYNKEGEIITFAKYLEDKPGVLSISSRYTNTHCSSTLYRENGIIKQQVTVNKNLRMDGEDADKLFNGKGVLYEKSSYKDGLRHCYDGKPSMTQWIVSGSGETIRRESYIDGFIAYKEEMIDGKMTPVPAIFEYDSNNVLIRSITSNKTGGIIGVINHLEEKVGEEKALIDDEVIEKTTTNHLKSAIQAKKLNDLIVAGKVQPDQLEALIKEGLDKKTVEAWEILYNHPTVEDSEYDTPTAEDAEKVLDSPKYSAFTSKDIIGFSKIKNEDVLEEKEESGLKKEAVKAAYRVAANQISKAVKTGLVTLMQKKGMDDYKLGHLREVLDTEIGDALISVSVGYILSMDKFSENEKAVKLANEFRVEGMATAGNVIVDSAINYILPSIMKETDGMKFRIEDTTNENAYDVETVEIDTSSDKEATA